MALLVLWAPALQPLDDVGSIVPGGKLTFYTAGSEDLKDTYADAEGDTENSNPVVLDAAGRSTVFLDDDGPYDVEFTDANDDVIWTRENIISAAPAVE